MVDDYPAVRCLFNRILVGTIMEPINQTINKKTQRKQQRRQQQQQRKQEKLLDLPQQMEALKVSPGRPIVLNDHFKVIKADGQNYPLIWINELYQNITLREYLQLNPIYDFVFEYDLTNLSRRVFRVYFKYQQHGHCYQLSREGPNLADAQKAVALDFYNQMNPQIPIPLADGQMDSTTSTVQGTPNLEGEKTINVIMTKDVPTEETTNDSGMWMKKTHLTSLLASSEERATFPILQSRWLQIDHFVLKTTDKIGDLINRWNLPSRVYDAISMPNKLPFQQFVLCRPSLEVKIKVNSHKFAQGRYIASLYYDRNPTGIENLPNSGINDNNVVYNMIAQANRDHVFMDLNESNELLINIPYRAKTPFVSTRVNASDDYRGGEFATVMLSCVTPLRVGTGASTEVPVTVFARFIDTQFTGMRYFEEVKPADGQMGSGQSLLDGCKNIVSGVRNLPVIGGICGAATTALSNVALAVQRPFRSDADMKAAEERFRYVGLIGNRDKPIDFRQPTEFRPNVVGNIALGTHVEPTLAMRLDATCTNIILGDHQPEGTFESIKPFLQIWGLLNIFQWEQATGAQTLLWSEQASPIFQREKKNTIMPMIEYFSNYYTYYSGTLEYRFDFIATQFHTGMIMIAYIPYDAEFSYSEARAGYYKIFDLREAKTVTFTIPYISFTLVRNVGSTSDAANTGYDTLSPGMIGVWVVNPLTPIQSVSTTLDVVVYKRGGPDFEYSYIRQSSNLNYNIPDEKLLTYGTDGQIVPTVRKRRRNHLTMEPSDGQMDQGTKEDLDQSPDFQPGLPGATLVNLMEDHMNIPNIMKRWVLLEQDFEILAKGTYLPVRPHVNYNPNSPSLQTSIQFAIMRLFRWYRGGIKIMLVTTTTDPNVIYISHYPQNTYQPEYGKEVKQAASSTDTLLGNSVGTGMATQIWCPQINPTIKLEIPYHGHWNYLDIQAGLYNNTATNFAIPKLVDIMATNLGYLKIVPKTTLKVDIWISCSDDFIMEMNTGFSAITPMYNIYKPEGTVELQNRNNIWDTLYIWTEGKKTREELKVGNTFQLLGGRQYQLTTGEYVDYNFKNTPGKDQVVFVVTQTTAQIELYEKEQKIKTLIKDEEFVATLPKFYELDWRVLPTKLVTGVNGTHYEDCCWADDDCEEGPDTCRCVSERLRARNDREFLRRMAADGQMDESQIEDDHLNHTGPTDVTLPRRPVWDFCVKACSGVKDTLTSPYTLYKDTQQLITKRLPNIASHIEGVANKADDLMEYLKDVALNITAGVKKACSWVVSGAAIFSSILHFLQTILNPCWQSFCLALCGTLTSIGLFIGNFGEQLLSFFLSLRQGERAPEDHRTGGNNGGEADGQCSHPSCRDCGRTCHPNCTLCNAETTDMFLTEQNIASLCGLVFGAVSAFLGYKGETPGAGIGRKLFNFTKNFWLTVHQSGYFLRDMVTLIKRCFNWCKRRTLGVQDAIVLTEQTEGLAEFIEEAQKMTDQRNISTLSTDPNMKYRFWCCVAAAYQYQHKFTTSQAPEGNAVLRICKQVIETANKESIQAMACPVRYEPFVICLEGPTKIGKSFMAQDILPELLGDEEVYNVKTYDSPVYARTPGVEFWNGYRSQPCVLYDDFMAVTAPEIAAKQVIELYNLKSSAIMNMNMANLEEKSLRGNPLVVALCTNNAFATLNGTTCPPAFHRRKDALWYVSLNPKYKSISQVPDDEKRRYDHLIFKRYADPGVANSFVMEKTSDGKTRVKEYDFGEFYNTTKQEMIQYHAREQQNVKTRLDRLKALLPEKARTMMHEVDPYRVFYSAYCGAADTPGLIQTGALPSEIVAEQLDIIAAAQQQLAANPPEAQAGTSADGQLPGLDIFGNIYDAIKSLLYEKPEIPDPLPDFFVEQYEMDECPVCREETSMIAKCENGHKVCSDCFAGVLRANDRAAEDLFIQCPTCRGNMRKLSLIANVFKEELRIVLLFRRARDSQIGQNLISLVKKILNSPYFQVGLCLAAYAGLLSLITYSSAKMEISRLNSDFALRHMLNPRSPIGNATLARIGPLFYQETTYTLPSGQIEDEYLDAEPGTSQVVIDSEYPHLTRTRSRWLVRGPVRKPVRTVIGDCPHREMLQRDVISVFYEQANDGEFNWVTSDFPPIVAPDAPCQFDTCPFGDPNFRHNYLNLWAYEHEVEIRTAVANFNRNRLAWTLPREYLTEVVENSMTQQQNALAEHIRSLNPNNTPGAPTFLDKVKGKWDSMGKILKIAVAIVAGLATFLGGYKLLQWLTSKPTTTAGQIFNSGAFHNRRLTHSLRRPLTATRRVIGQNNDPFGSDIMQTAMRRIEQNVVFLRIQYRENTKLVKNNLRLFGIFGRCCITPKHQAMYLAHLYSKKEQGLITDLEVNWEKFGQPQLQFPFKYDVERIMFGENEIAYFLVPPQMAMFKDITNLVPTIEQHANIAYEYMHIEPQFNSNTVLAIRGGIKGVMERQGLKETEFHPAYDMFDVYLSTYGKPGACGAIYAAPGNAPIFAMHAAGYNDNAYNSSGFGVPLVREDLEALKEGTLVLSTYQPDGLKSAADGQFQLPGHVELIASVDKKQVSFMPTKTKIEPSMIHNQIEGISVKTQPAILSAKDKRFEYDQSPLYWGCLKHTKPIKEMDEDKLDLISSFLQEKIVAEMKPLRNLSKPITREMAICGVKDLPGYDTIDLKTSSGWPWNIGQTKTKEALITVERDEQQFAVKANIDPLLSEVMDQKEKQRKQGIKPFTVFLDWLKDERRKEKKIKDPAGTRIFSLSPVDFTIQLRQRTLDFAAAYMANREKLYHAVGISTDGPEWSRLANRLLDNSKRIVTGDYADFGPRLSVQALHRAFDIIKAWYKHYVPMTIEEERELAVMAEEISNAYHICNDTIYQTFCGAPSGSALTVILNSIVNTIYIMYAWLQLTEGTEFCTLEGFNSNVVLVTYGDDLIMSVKEKVLDIFNCQTIASTFAELDLVFTDASKTGNEKDTTIEKATFLKCGFLKHPKRAGHWLAPLEELSIHECAQWVWKSNDIRSATRLNAEQSVLLAFGHGPIYFNNWKLKINQVLRKVGLEGISITWNILDKKFFGQSVESGSFTPSSQFYELLGLKANRSVVEQDPLKLVREFVGGIVLDRTGGES